MTSVVSIDAYLVQLTPLDHNGNPLAITASDEVKKTVESGAYIELDVKYGLFQLLATTANLCEQLNNVDLSALEPGKMTITKSVELPSAIPPV